MSAQMLSQAVHIFLNGNLQEALDLFDLIPLDSTHYRTTCYWRCRAYSQLKEFDRAIKVLDELSESNFEPLIYAKRAEIFSDWKKHEEAYDAYCKYLEQHPRDMGALINRGYLLHYYLERFEEAKQDFLQAKTLANSEVVCNNLGTLYRDGFKQYDKSLLEFDEAIRLNPSSANPFAQKALLMFFMNKTEEALSLVQKAITVNPKYAFSYYVKAVVYESQHNWIGAIQNYDKMLQVGYHIERYTEDAKRRLKVLKTEHPSPSTNAKNL